jgi:hypothetical protein
VKLTNRSCTAEPLLPLGCGLPMSAAVTAATTVRAAATAMYSSATVEAATGRAAMETATDCSASDVATAPTVVTAAPAVSRTKTTSAPTWASVEPAVEPRACADEQATGEVARTVVPVRRTGVRVIPIVTVGADRSRTDISRTDAYSDGDALSASVRREGQGSSKYCKNHQIFDQMFHF